MRGDDIQQGAMFSYLSPEQRFRIHVEGNGSRSVTCRRGG